MKRGKLLKTTFVTLMVCATAGTLFACGGKDKEYKVVYLGGEEATGEAPAEATYKEGTEITLAQNTFTKEGYTFTGWSDGATTYGAGVKYTVNADVTFTAQWKENSTPLPDKYTVTYALGDHAATDATAPEAAKEIASGTQVTLPNAPKAEEGYEFTGWKVGDDTTLKQPGDKITVTANVTVTAQWKQAQTTPDDDILVEADIKDAILNWYTANSKYYYVGDGEEVTVQAIITKDNPDAWTGVMADIALNNDFYRFRPDGYVWTNSGKNSGANREELALTVDPAWNDETVAAYKALFANGASVIQVIKISLKDNVVTLSNTSYAGTDTELKTPVVTATYTVTSATDITDIQPYFYTDGGAVVTAASAKAPKASNTFVNLTFDYDNEGVENAVVPMRPGKDNYVFGANPVKPGYAFLGWKSSDEADTKLYKDTDEVPVTGAVTYTAQWEQEQYTVTYALGENAAETATAPEAVSGKIYGDKIELPAAPAAASGYEFAGWKIGDATDLKEAEAEVEVTGNVTITAVFNAKEQFTATFKVGEHAAEGAAVADITVYYDDAEITLPAAPAAATGYEFAGWKVGDDTKAAGEKITLTASAEITAQWEAIEYTVTFNVGEHAAEGASVPAMKADYNTEITVPAAPAAASGFTFAGWKVGASETIVHPNDKLLVTADATLTAQWVSTENSYTVTFLANEDDTTPYSTQVVEKDATDKKLALPATNPEKAGYSFVGWYLLSDTTKTVLTEATLPDVTENITVVAKWQAVFTVTVLNDLDGEAVDGAKTEYASSGTPEKFVAPTGVTKNGFTLVGWFEVVDGAYGDEVTATTDITKSMTVAAKWNEIKYTVTYELGDHAATGATAPAEAEVTQLVGKVTLPAAPQAAKNYVFSGWKVGESDELKDAGAEIDVTADVTITAQYVQIADTQKYTLGTWGQTLPNSFTLMSGHFIEVELNGYLTGADGNVWDGLVTQIIQPSKANEFFFFQNNAGTAKVVDNNWTATDIWTSSGFEISITNGAGENVAIDDNVFKTVRADGTTTIRVSLAPAAEAGKYTLTAVTTLTAKDADTATYVITRTRTMNDAKLTVYFALAASTANPVKVTASLPTAENPIVIASTGYMPSGWMTQIRKGEKVEFVGTSASTGSVHFHAPIVSLASTPNVLLAMRSDNFVVGGDNASNLATEGFASITPACQSSGADGAFWTDMHVVKNNGNVKITVDWTAEKTIVVTIALTEKDGGAKFFTQNYTVALTEGNTKDSYNLVLGGEACTLTVNSIVRTPAN